MYRLLKILIVLLFLSSPCYAATYYVDFATGADTNNGTSDSTPFKHCPGDPNATDTANSTTLAAGDTVNFKGGVSYYGQIEMTESGNTGAQITYDGDAASHGWGTGKAIIDGTTTLSWTACPDAGTCGGNANYASMYYATLPVDSDWMMPIFDNGSWVYLQSNPVQSNDPWRYDDCEYYHITATNMTSTTVTDATVLTSADSDHYTGAYLMHHQWIGNSTNYGKISAFNPSTDTVTFANLGYTPSIDTTWDDNYHYSIVNNWREISAANYYAIDEDNSKVYIYPTTDDTNLRVGSLNYAFDVSGESYITITGFVTHGQYGTDFVRGRIINSSDATANGNIIENCDFTNATRGTEQPSSNVYIRGGSTRKSIYQNNTMSRLYGRGVLGSGTEIDVLNNEFEYVTGSVIWYFTIGSDISAGELSGNYIHDCGGVHANGIVLYGASTIYEVYDVNIHDNRVIGYDHRKGPYGLTMQRHRDLTIYNNVIDGETTEQIRSQVSACGFMRWYSNTFIDPNKEDGHNQGFTVTKDHADCSEYTVKGNIIDGYGGDGTVGASYDGSTHEYNVYVSLNDVTQKESYGWTIDATEDVSNQTSEFTNSATNDFTLRLGATAIDFMPIAQAPTGTFTTDLNGDTRDNNWDSGAYEFNGEPPGSQSQTGNNIIKIRSTGNQQIKIKSSGGNSVKVY